MSYTPRRLWDAHGRQQPNHAGTQIGAHRKPNRPKTRTASKTLRSERAVFAIDHPLTACTARMRPCQRWDAARHVRGAKVKRGTAAACCLRPQCARGPFFCATRNQGVVGEQPGASGRAWECGAGRSGGRARGGAQGYAQQLRVSELSEWTQTTRPGMDGYGRERAQVSPGRRPGVGRTGRT